MKRLRSKRGVWVAVGVVAIVAAWLLLIVDDWGRDFTTNVAEISPTAADPRLRPVELDRPADVVADAIKDAARRLGNWELTGEASGGDAIALSFVRTTKVWRLKNDVTLRVEDRGGRSRITGDSRSRVGKGDLGQNPRNLREILDETRSVLASNGRDRT